MFHSFHSCVIFHEIGISLKFAIIHIFHFAFAAPVTEVLEYSIHHKEHLSKFMLLHALLVHNFGANCMLHYALQQGFEHILIQLKIQCN